VSNSRPWSIAELNEMVEQGRMLERNRILRLLTDLKSEFLRKEELERYLSVAVKRINE
jgi:hypothetical protein